MKIEIKETGKETILSSVQHHNNNEAEEKLSQIIGRDIKCGDVLTTDDKVLLLDAKVHITYLYDNGNLYA